MNEASGISIPERLGRALAQSSAAREMRWVDSLSPEMRFLVHEYDVVPVKLAIKVGCNSVQEVSALCKSMMERGFLRKGISASAIRGLAGRMFMGKHRSRRKTERALQIELADIDAAYKVCGDFPELSTPQLLSELLDRMRMLHQDILKLKSIK